MFWRVIYELESGEQRRFDPPHSDQECLEQAVAEIKLLAERYGLELSWAQIEPYE